MSIRLRLTLLYTAILALTLIAFSAALYATQARFTLTRIQDDVRMVADRTAQIPVLFRRRPWPPADPAPAGPTPSPEEQPFRELQVRDKVHILDTQGQILFASGAQEPVEIPLSQTALDAILAGREHSEIVTLDQERWLVLNRPIAFEGQVLAIVQVARSLGDRDRSLRMLGVSLIGGSLLMTCIAFGIGWTLASAALHPIQRITQTAQAIGAEQDFGRRVEHPGPRDELGQLATTFNEMLARLQGAYDQVEKSLATQREFVADVSHELRTPLTTIRGNLALLGREPPIPPDERQDILSDMIDETERLIRLVNDLLVLARTDANPQTMVYPLHVGPLLDDVCRQARTIAPAREFNYTAEPGLQVLANRDLLKQVLLILLDNAIKHTQGQVDVTAARVPVGGERERVRICVRDSGPGMPSDVSARIFDRFYRADKARATPGFGLGLSIAQALVEAQNGHIAVESRAGEGTVFAVTLPRAPGPSGTPDPQD